MKGSSYGLSEATISMSFGGTEKSCEVTPGSL